MIEKLIAQIIEESLNHMGYDLVRVQVSGQHRLKVEIMIDKFDESPITMSDCVKVSRHVSVLLDVEDPLKDPYTLEVTSPGLDRPLVRHKDFVRFCGACIKFKTVQSIEGQKRFKGTLVGVQEDHIEVELDDHEDLTVIVTFDNIQSAKLIPDYDALTESVRHE